MRYEHILERVRVVGDLLLAYDARRALEGVREPQQPRHRRRVPVLVEFQHAGADLVDQLPGLDPEVAQRVRCHQRRPVPTSSSRSLDSVARCAAVCLVCTALTSVSRVTRAVLAAAPFTCSTAEVCCLVESSISRVASLVVATSCAIRRNESVASSNWRAPASTAFTPISVAITVVLTAARTSSRSVRISLAEPAVRSASLRISSATTANRRPHSPAPLASMVALIARMF